MKRTLGALFFLLCLSVGLTGCGGSGSESNVQQEEFWSGTMTEQNGGTLEFQIEVVRNSSQISGFAMAREGDTLHHGDLTGIRNGEEHSFSVDFGGDLGIVSFIDSDASFPMAGSYTVSGLGLTQGTFSLSNRGVAAGLKPGTYTMTWYVGTVQGPSGQFRISFQNGFGSNLIATVLTGNLPGLSGPIGPGTGNPMTAINARFVGNTLSFVLQKNGTVLQWIFAISPSYSNWGTINQPAISGPFGITGPT